MALDATPLLFYENSSTPFARTIPFYHLHFVPIFFPLLDIFIRKRVGRARHLPRVFRRHQFRVQLFPCPFALFAPHIKTNDSQFAARFPFQFDEIFARARGLELRKRCGGRRLIQNLPRRKIIDAIARDRAGGE